MHLFQVTETRPTRYVVNGVSSIAAEYAYKQAAEDAAMKVLKNSFFNKANSWAYGIFRNIAGRVGPSDLSMIETVLTDWINDIQPQFAAIEGKVGYHVTPGQHRLITTADGKQHGSREAAATHVLSQMLRELRSRLSNETVKALCNANRYSNDPNQVTDFQYTYRFFSLFQTLDGKFYHDFDVRRVVKIRDAIKAMIIVKNIPYEVQ